MADNATVQPGTILLLTRHPETYAVRRLLQAAAERGVALRLLDPHLLQLRVAGGRLEALLPDGGALVPLPEGCFILPRLGSLATEYSLAALAHLEQMGLPSLCGSAAIGALRHKFSALCLLARAGIPVPDSAMLRAPGELGPAVESLGGYPVVLKFIRGSQGLGVVYCADETAAQSILDAMNYVQYDVLLQRYYPAAAQADTRVLVLGGEARWAVRRISQDGRFRSNFHRGGRAERLDLTPELARLAEQAVRTVESGSASVPLASYSGGGGFSRRANDESATEVAATAKCSARLGLAGVDIITGLEGEPLVLEVNASPGFETIEQGCGCDCAWEIITDCVIRPGAGGARV